MARNKNEPIPLKEEITVSFLISKLKEQLNIDVKPTVGKKHWNRQAITDDELHRPGLALAGYVGLFTHHRIQILGNTECKYLGHLSKNDRVEAFKTLLQFEIPAIFLTDNNSLPAYLIDEAKKAHVPVFKTPVETTRFMQLVRDFLEDQFALQTLVHGTMMDVYGIGILIMGKSGIGKSEVALDLIERGHRLVADDVVMLTKKNKVLMSTPTELNKHFMEIRGLGIVDIISMFGIRSIRYQKRLEVVLELSLWQKDQEVNRTGLNHDFTSLLGVDVPRIKLPITPGKNITVIAEVIAMNYLLRHYGYDPAKAFQEKVKNHIAKNKQHAGFPKRAVEYFEGDKE